jgi:leucyl-tRNA synthetase
MQANPPTDTVLWSDESVEGSFKFLRRLWTMVHDHVQAGVVARYSGGELDSTLKELRFKLHKAVEKVGDDYGRRMQFNTAIAAIREMLNLYTDLKDRSPAARAVAQEVLEDAVLLLSPVIPHITTVLWSELRPGTRLLDQPWPSVDASALVQDSIEIVVQVNGKLRGRIQVPSDATQEPCNRSFSRTKRSEVHHRCDQEVHLRTGQTCECRRLGSFARRSARAAGSLPTQG